MVVGFIEGHPIISIPTPHADEHPGLAQFSGASIVPMLRFYSFSFRCFVIMCLAFILILRPYFKFIGIHGKNAPAVFQKKVGTIKWDFRSMPDENHWSKFAEMPFILDSLETIF